LGRIGFGRSGLLTVAGDVDHPVEVTRIAIEVGINCRVTFSPEVWVACNPADPHADELLNAAYRNQHARLILVSLARSLRKMQNGQLLFRSNGPRRPMMLVAIVQGDEVTPELMVMLAAKRREK
jgi:hypothetical protein